MKMGSEAPAVRYLPVIIVGAGESGIAMGCKLKSELGLDDFIILDRQQGIGGTWWINQYPGKPVKHDLKYRGSNINIHRRCC